jgi:hypothetical protein
VLHDDDPTRATVVTSVKLLVPVLRYSVFGPKLVA